MSSSRLYVIFKNQLQLDLKVAVYAQNTSSHVQKDDGLRRNARETEVLGATETPLVLCAFLDPIFVVMLLDPSVSCE